MLSSPQQANYSVSFFGPQLSFLQSSLYKHSLDVCLRFGQRLFTKFESPIIALFSCNFFLSLLAAVYVNLCPLVLQASQTGLPLQKSIGKSQGTRYSPLVFPYPEYRLPSSVCLIFIVFHYFQIVIIYILSRDYIYLNESQYKRGYFCIKEL